jgi:hypothetical protein
MRILSQAQGAQQTHRDRLLETGSMPEEPLSMPSLAPPQRSMDADVDFCASETGVI